MPTKLADAPPGEIGDPGPDIADLELDRIATWSCYQEVRRTTEALCAPLEIEDYVIQSMPDASPAKWHLAHTSWFFETFVLASVQPGFEPVDSEYSYIFNSYYNAVGERIARDRRGVLSRPTVAEVFRYRAAVDKRMKELLDRAGNTAFERVRSTLILGLHHEQQHQELILTDIKHALASNPRRPAYRERRTETVAHAGPGAPGWIPFAGSLRSIGHESASFAFDNEGPRHQQYVAAFALADRLVTNREYLTFMDDGGYERPEFWLSDGWYAPVATAGLPRSTGNRPRAGTRSLPSKACEAWISTSRSAMSATTKPTPSPAGRGPGCPPRLNGRRRPWPPESPWRETSWSRVDSIRLTR